MHAEVKSVDLTEWFSLMSLSILWGGFSFFVSVAVKALPPLTIVEVRVILVAITLLAVVYFSGLKMPANRKVWFAFFWMYILNNINLLSAIFFLG